MKFEAATVFAHRHIALTYLGSRPYSDVMCTYLNGTIRSGICKCGHRVRTRRRGERDEPRKRHERAAAAGAPRPPATTSGSSRPPARCSSPTRARRSRPSPSTRASASARCTGAIPARRSLLRRLSADGLQRFIDAAEAALADHGDPWEAFAGFMRRCVDADTNSLTQRLAGTFTPTEELYREAGRAQGLLTALFDRTQAAGAIRKRPRGQRRRAAARADRGDPHRRRRTRTLELRHRYLALMLDAVRAERDELPGPAPGLAGDRRTMEPLSPRALTAPSPSGRCCSSARPVTPAEAIRLVTRSRAGAAAPYNGLWSRVEGFPSPRGRDRRAPSWKRRHARRCTSPMPATTLRRAARRARPCGASGAAVLERTSRTAAVVKPSSTPG